MGRLFFDHINGVKLYSCAACDTNLTNKNELISTRFTGATGEFYWVTSMKWKIQNGFCVQNGIARKSENILQIPEIAKTSDDVVRIALKGNAVSGVNNERRKK